MPFCFALNLSDSEPIHGHWHMYGTLNLDIIGFNEGLSPAWAAGGARICENRFLDK